MFKIGEKLGTGLQEDKVSHIFKGFRHKYFNL